jgi:hypothetical protein
MSSCSLENAPRQLAPVRLAVGTSPAAAANRKQRHKCTNSVCLTHSVCVRRQIWRHQKPQASSQLIKNSYLTVRNEKLFVQILSSWTLPIVLYLSKNTVLFIFQNTTFRRLLPRGPRRKHHSFLVCGPLPSNGRCLVVSRSLPSNGSTCHNIIIKTFCFLGDILVLKLFNVITHNPRCKRLDKLLRSIWKCSLCYVP